MFRHILRIEDPNNISIFAVFKGMFRQLSPEEKLEILLILIKLANSSPEWYALIQWAIEMESKQLSASEYQNYPSRYQTINQKIEYQNNYSYYDYGIIPKNNKYDSIPESTNFSIQPSFTDLIRRPHEEALAQASLDDAMKLILIDLDRIEKFLADFQEVQQILNGLELELRDWAKDLLDTSGALLKDSYMSRTERKPGHRKVLSTYFATWAKSNGFTGLTKLTKPLSTKQFYSMLSDTTLFKDVTFKGTSHGTWTHLVQWWCVVAKAKQDPSFLHHQPAHIYKIIGKIDKKFNTKIWANLFEVAKSKTSYGNVFRLHGFFEGNAKKQLPVLAQFIERYETKPKSFAK